MKQDTSMAKLVFLYLLSLLSLAFVTVACGNVVFQLINKYFPDIASSYANSYNLSALRFAISALIVAAPVYFVSVWQINKNLAMQVFDRDNAVRKWLTYFILLIAAVIMIGDLIFVVNSFLEGELTAKFALKTVTVLALAGAVFGYYLYDIRREQFDKKDAVILSFRYGAIAAVVVVFIAGLFFVESPSVAREKRLDSQVAEQLAQLEGAIQNYYTDEDALPQDLNQVVAKVNYVIESDVHNPVTKKQIEYEVVSETDYRLCTEFLRSTMEDSNSRYEYYDKSWRHEAGRYCFKREVQDFNNQKPQPIPVR